MAVGFESRGKAEGGLRTLKARGRNRRSLDKLAAFEGQRQKNLARSSERRILSASDCFLGQRREG